MEITGGIQELLAEIEPVTSTARVLLRQSLQERHDALDAELMRVLREDAVANREPLAPAIEAELEELEAEMESASRVFKFRALSRLEWQEIVAKHPPSKETRRTDPRAEVDDRKFWPEAIAASCVDPKMTIEDAHKLQSGWKTDDGEQRPGLNDAQWNLLVEGCAKANRGGGTLGKSLALGRIRQVREQSAASVLETDGLSPDPSSSAE
jgi:hypothetical protein